MCKVSPWPCALVSSPQWAALSLLRRRSPAWYTMDIVDVPCPSPLLRVVHSKKILNVSTFDKLNLNSYLAHSLICTACVSSENSVSTYLVILAGKARSILDFIFPFATDAWLSLSIILCIVRLRSTACFLIALRASRKQACCTIITQNTCASRLGCASRGGGPLWNVVFMTSFVSILFCQCTTLRSLIAQPKKSRIFRDSNCRCNFID